MLGFLTRSIAHRDSQPTIPAEESEGEQEEEDGVQIPGMPPAPKSITLSDPYPEGKLSGRNPVANAAPSKTPPDSADVGGPLEHDGSTTIIFVKAGSEHRALLYLMQKVNRTFGLDDVPPEVPPEVACFHYHILKAPKDPPVDGDAATDFTSSTVWQLEGLVVRRVKVLARDPLLAGHVDSTTVQRRGVAQRLAEEYRAGLGKGSGPPHGSVGAQPGSPSRATPAGTSRPEWAGIPSRRAAQDDRAEKRRAPQRRRPGPQELVPVAMLSAPRYLATVASVVRTFNRSGLIVTPYLYATVVGASAVCTIQGWWKSHRVRGMGGNFAEQLRSNRAARTIQRAWRAFILRNRLCMLSAMRRTVTTIGALLLGANVALTALDCALLRDAIGRAALARRPTAVFPEQRLRFGLDRAGCLLLVEPERALPRPRSEGNWHGGLPQPPAPRSLPLWCGLQLPLAGERAAAQLHGCREVLGARDAAALITSHTVWKDHAGREISRASLPDTASADPTALAATLLGGGNADNVILAIINFSTVHEAAARAALLLAYTWDVRRRRGCTLVPLHATAQARGMALQAAGDAAVAAYGTKPPTAGSMTAADSSIFGGGGGGSRGLSPAMTPAAGSPPVSPSPFAWRHATRGDRQQQQGGSRGSTPLGTAPGSPARGAPHSPKPQQQQQQQQLSPERSRRTTQAEGSSRTGTPQPHSPRGQQAHSPGPGPHGSPSPTGQRSSGPASPGSSPQRSPQRSPLRSPQGRGAPAPAAAVPHPVPLMRPGTVPTIPSKFFDLGSPAQLAQAPGHPTHQRPHGVQGMSPRPSTVPANTAAAGALLGEISFTALPQGGLVFPPSPTRSPGGLYERPSDPPPDIPASSLARALTPGSPPRGNTPASPTRAGPPSPTATPPIPGSPGSGQHRSASPSRLAGGNFAAFDVNQLSPAVLSRGSSPSRVVHPQWGAPSPQSASALPPSDSRSASPMAAGNTGDAPSLTHDRAAAHLQPGQVLQSTVSFPAGSEPPSRSSPFAPSPEGVPRPASSGAGSVWLQQLLQQQQQQLEEQLPLSAVPPHVAAEDGVGYGAGGGGVGYESGRSSVVSVEGAAPDAAAATEQLGVALLPHMGSAHDAQGLLLPPQENQQGEPQYPQGYADGQLGDQQVLYAPGFEPGCDQEPIAPPPDPLAGLSVLQREQALGLYRNMVLLPLPQQGLSGGRGGDAGRGGRGAAADRDQGSQQESFRPGPTDGTPELVVSQVPVELIHVPTLLASTTAEVAAQRRDDRHVADASHRMERVMATERKYDRHRELMGTLMLTQVIGRQTAVGHVHAPGYVPLPTSLMAEIVGEMRRVYCGEAAEMVAGKREQHRRIMEDIEGEKKAVAAYVAATSGMQAAVVDSVLQRQEEDRSRAGRARVTRANMRAMRRQRAAQDRAFAMALGRQVAGLGKQIVRSELRARDVALQAEAAEAAACKKDMERLAQDHITVARQDLKELNRWKAASVRSEGWTEEVAEYYALLDMSTADEVALRRDENYARMRRTGPAGGVWGAARPKEDLRAPLPLSSVVSAAAAAAAHRTPVSATSAASRQGPYGPYPPYSAGSSGMGGRTVADVLPGSWQRVAGVGEEEDEDAGVRRSQSVGSYMPGVSRGSMTSAWGVFEGDNGSMAGSSGLPSRQTPRRWQQPEPEPLPQGYVPGSAAESSRSASMAGPWVEGGGVQGTGEQQQQLGGQGGVGREREKGRRHGSFGGMEVGPDGVLVDYLPEAYAVRPYGSRQGGGQGPPRPVGMVVSRY